MVLTLEVGQMVKKGAMHKFNEFIPTIFETEKEPDQAFQYGGDYHDGL